MHITRQEVSLKIPLKRKGTKYVVRTSSHMNESIPVLIALRDMLKIAKTSREVKEMLRQKLIKINWKDAKDIRESIKLFNILHADKDYRLSISPNGRFFLEEIKDEKIRVVKVINKKILKKGIVQINFHDGMNLITKEKIKTGDSIYLDDKNNIKKIVPLKSGAKGFIIRGRFIGNNCSVESVEGKKVTIKINEKNSKIDKGSLIIL